MNKRTVEHKGYHNQELLAPHYPIEIHNLLMRKSVHNPDVDETQPLRAASCRQVPVVADTPRKWTHSTKKGPGC